MYQVFIDLMIERYLGYFCYFFESYIINSVSTLRRYDENYRSYDHYIDVQKSDRCRSFVGMVRPQPQCNKCQPLKLWFDENNVEQSCMFGIGTVIHEFLHALGKLRRMHFNYDLLKQDTIVLNSI